jgi:hypothetical protein
LRRSVERAISVALLLVGIATSFGTGVVLGMAGERPRPSRPALFSLAR